MSSNSFKMTNFSRTKDWGLTKSEKRCLISLVVPLTWALSMAINPEDMFPNTRATTVKLLASLEIQEVITTMEEGITGIDTRTKSLITITSKMPTGISSPRLKNLNPILIFLITNLLQWKSIDLLLLLYSQSKNLQSNLNFLRSPKAWWRKEQSQELKIFQQRMKVELLSQIYRTKENNLESMIRKRLSCKIDITLKVNSLRPSQELKLKSKMFILLKLSIKVINNLTTQLLSLKLRLTISLICSEI